jgi:hypothetical protein
VFNPVLADNDLDPRAPCPLGIESTPVAGTPQLTPAIAIQSDVMPIMAMIRSLVN